MQNYILQKKEVFPNLINDACKVLAGWRIQYKNHHVRCLTKANDGVEFMTTGNEKKNDDRKKKYMIQMWNSRPLFHRM